jgi:threonyl-tRNA synthetase
MPSSSSSDHSFPELEESLKNLAVAEDAPEYMRKRLQVWFRVKASRNEQQPSADIPIRVTLPDGQVKMAIKGKTTPMDISKELFPDLAKRAIVAVVNDKLWDLNRPLEEDCSLKICDFETPEGKSVLWHSTAHMVGEAMEYIFKGELCIGPPIENGFYYDMHTEHPVREADLKELEKKAYQIAKSKRTFERMELKKEEAKEMFSYNPFKLEIIEKLGDDETITAYRDGPFIDLCRGPHVPVSSMVKALSLTKTGQAYWLGDAKNPSLQRVYGISFPDSKMLKEYLALLEEAEKRDHRLIGKKQELWTFHPWSPGCCFFYPHGTRIYNKLVEFIRKEYWKRGYEEVITPNLFDFQLWETSGHAQAFKEDMFLLSVENREFGLKPMNCPGHCLLFGSRQRSYRELPLRYADFGVLHRNELSGTLSGLTRVRRFQQDDAHIFCMPSQVESEVKNMLEFLKYVYELFGFTFELVLSTRPEKFIGDIDLWNKAEEELKRALEDFTGKSCNEKDGWTLNPGDGAFYGPKIDVKIHDSLQRKHQSATIQLDFQLPIRFDLVYHAPSRPKQDSSPSEEEEPELHRPVIIHRAILGSVERFLGIYTEHCAGKWPFWLSPRQVIVIPVSEKYIEYGQFVRNRIHEQGFFVDIDTSDRKLAKKIREGQLAQYNYLLVVGDKEAADNTVNVRTRSNQVIGEKSLDDILEEFHRLQNNYE